MTIGKTIRGTRLDDVLLDTLGNDYIAGRGGDDELFATYGNNTLVGGMGDDELFDGDGDDALFGGAGNDILYGRGGTNVLNGGAGNDQIFGPGTVTLGAGRDTFWLSGYDQQSTVTDFSIAHDQLRIDSLLEQVRYFSFAPWDPTTNPFAEGFLRLSQDGADTLVEVLRETEEYDPIADDYVYTYTFEAVVRLENVTASDLSDSNFAPGVDPILLV